MPQLELSRIAREVKNVTRILSYKQVFFSSSDELLLAKQFSLVCIYRLQSLWCIWLVNVAICSQYFRADTTELVSSSAQLMNGSGERASLLYKLSGETYISFSSNHLYEIFRAIK